MGGEAGSIPEYLQECLAVGHHLVLPDPCVAKDGGSVALDAEVAPKLHIEAHLYTALCQAMPPPLTTAEQLQLQCMLGGPRQRILRNQRLLAANKLGPD